MNRIKETFNQLKKNNKKALGIFLTAGDPNFESSLNLIQQLPENGVDFVEIGMPFSDPMADGPSIQLSSQRALKSGMNLIKCLSLVEKFRKLNTHTPIILMGYYNPIYKFGKEKFIQLCLNSGVDGLIIVDLPPEEDEEFYIEAEKNKLSIIRLVTPTTNQKRLNKILFNATGFVYYVSITGITGTQAPNIENVSKNLEKITRIFFMHRRKMIKKPYNQLFAGNNNIASKLNIDLNLRPQNLDFETYFKIAREYENLSG